MARAQIPDPLCVAMLVVSVFASAFHSTLDAQGHTTFYPVAELTAPDAATPTLRGATPANPHDWPASFYSFQAGKACTSTLVAGKVLLTAAHCVTDQQVITVRAGGAARPGKCEWSSLRRAGNTT